MLITLTLGAKGGRNPLRRPGGIPVLVTAGAGVRGADVLGDVWPGHTQGVIVAGIDHHVGPSGHVTGDALGAGGPQGVQRVAGLVEPGRGMALGAEAVARGARPTTVGVMTVGTGDTLGIHAALEEGAVVIDFILLLTIGEIRSLEEQQGVMGRHQRPAVAQAIGKAGTAGMALGADLDFAAALQGWGAYWLAVGILAPTHPAALVEGDCQALGLRQGRRHGLVTRQPLSPDEVV